MLTETSLVIKKAYARAYLPGLYKIFFLYLLTRLPDFLSRFRNLAGATQIIKIDKIESQVAPAEEAVPFVCQYIPVCLKVKLYRPRLVIFYCYNTRLR